MTRKRIAVYHFIFILLVTAICHFLFSPLGFNPTDEGFVLSATNRVLHGQIPHVDFTSVRPLGYAYLHIPELLISRTHFFLISRAVFWLENVLIAFLWIRFLSRYIQVSLHNFYLLVLVTFIFNVHYFPCSVLHTIDGLLFCLIGLNIVAVEKRYSFLGFLFIGFAALCKQNYLIVLPVALLLFNRKSFLLNIISGFIPAIVYIFLVSYYGGWNDVIIQLSGHNELIQVGVKNYLFNYFFLAAIAFALIAKKVRLPGIYYIYVIFGIQTGLLLTHHYHGSMSFFIAGVLLYEWLFTHEKKLKNVIAMCLILAWCVSISVGYNTPALFSGACITLLILKINSGENYTSLKTSFICLSMLLFAFYFVRTHFIYRDAVSTQLKYKLDGIVDGAEGIRTNKNTWMVLKELDSLKRVYPSLIPVPDFTACNVLQSHQSKIKTEWPNKTEIPNKQILMKVVGDIYDDSSLVFAIPRFQTALLKDSFTVIPNKGNEYPVVRFVKNNYPHEILTKYFELRSK